jgi:hypothetical protein
MKGASKLAHSKGFASGKKHAALTGSAVVVMPGIFLLPSVLCITSGTHASSSGQQESSQGLFYSVFSLLAV